jgi:hypothetical protein
VNTLRPAEETWFDQGKEGETKAWMAYAVLLLLLLFFCSSCRIIMMVQSERLAFAANVTALKTMRDTHKVLLGEYEEIKATCNT